MEASGQDRKPISLLRTTASEQQGRFSPDGRWLAYSSNRSGKFEIYVMPFDESNPAASASGGLQQVSKEGGSLVHWSRDGKELIYVAGDGYLTAVDVSIAGGALQIGKPQPLFKPPAGSWDVTKDGKQFLIAAPVASAAPPAARPLRVVLNWPEMVKR
jgi:Tol biopolymer transport system component